MKNSYVVARMLPLLALALMPAWASTITIGANSSSNEFPFTYSGYVGQYQQVYNGSLFSGPVSITGITFFGSTTTPAATITGTFTISFSATSAGLNTLSSTYANNIGANNTQFFNGTVNNTLSFSGTPFLYNPAQGNLLLNVNVVSGTGSSQFLAAGCSSGTNRVYNSSGSGAATVDTTCGAGLGYGLQTQFTFTPVGSTSPEPSALLMLATGLLTVIGVTKKLRM